MIAITGPTGYIANNLYEYFLKNGCEAKLVSVRNNIDNNTFAGVDTVIHAAGIVHIKAKREEYKKINTDLTKKIAWFAKKSGVKHFIFFSTMSVYGRTTGCIDGNTPLCPTNDYGRSKLAAEKAVFTLKDKDFCVTVLRPPMVYGKDCPGNYARLSALVKKIPFFPYTKNRRSMIYIENLCACVKKITDEKTEGILHPQNSEYVDTQNLCELIAKANGHKLYFFKTMGRAVGLLPFKTVKKVFGSLYYDKSITYENDVVSFKKTIAFTEEKN